MPAVVIWALLGVLLGALPLAGPALVAAAVYGCYYGAVEVSGRRGLPPPGRRWQVPQTMLLGAPPRRRVLVWGAVLGPGLLTRNPYAGFGVLPLAAAAMGGPAAGLALGAAMGAAHGTARAAALLRDVRELRPMAVAAPIAGGPGAIAEAGQAPVAMAVPTHLDLLLKTVYWRRADGAALLALAAAAAAAAGLRYLG